MNRETESVTLLDAPEIPGLEFRRYHGEMDLHAIVAVFAACKVVDGLERTLLIEDLRLLFDHLVNFDPYRDVLIAEINGVVIAFAMVYWETKARGDWIYNTTGYIVPEWRGKGIGTAMLRHNESSLRAIAQQHPDGVPKFIQRMVTESQEDLAALLSNDGYRVVRYHYDMVRPIETPLPLAQMPVGLEVRPVRVENYRQIWDANQEAFAENWWHRPATEEEYAYWLASPWFNPKLWMIAWEDNQVAGMVLNYINTDENFEFQRKRGYTEEICVRSPWRQRGLARSLLVQSINMFKNMGFEETALGVDASNESGALVLYESVGYQVVRRWLIFSKPLA